jgi:hypothetical protein
MLAPCCVAQTIKKPTSQQAEALEIFLRNYLGEPYPPIEREGPTRYSSALVDLNDDGTEEVIVYLSGAGWCGTGGCNMLILAREGTSYRIVTETTITRRPVRMLASKSNGWHDISVLVAGGGIQPGYEAELSFDGKTYPSNPSVLPAHPLQNPLENEVRRKTVISETAKDEALYPSQILLGELPEGSEAIVPGQSIGSLRLGLKKGELAVSWQAKPDSIVGHEDPCKGTEVVWFDNESRWHVPGVRDYVADDLVYEITAEWDKRFKAQGIGSVFGMILPNLQAAMPDGKLLQLKGSASERPGEADELFWIDSGRGIAFGLDYPRGTTPQNRSNRIHRLHRIVDSVTVFRPHDLFQPQGCANPNQPLVAAETPGSE